TPYDIIKEGTIALLVIALLTLILAVVFGSPDEAAITIKSWSNADPIDFATTALSELNGTSTSAAYGAPYNHNGPSQQIGPLQLAKWVGVRIPINSAQNFVIQPLKALPNEPTLDTDIAQYTSASSATQTGWLNAYAKAATNMKFVKGQVVVNATNSGPVPVMINDLTTMARSGALDQDLLNGNGFYTTDYTKPLLFLADSQYLGNLAATQHLTGEQWGMMNETGNYPGQAWLWLYTFWYQIPPFNNSGNGDALVWGVMMVLSVILLLVPLIPGLRSVPRKLRIYRLIWREHYRDAGGTS
ncbi:MAG TPA: cytochrome B6, partial [Acidimicrobiales bacterium]